MPIQFPDMMPVPKPEEANPFLSQLTKGLELAVGYPKQLRQADIANALKQIELQYAPEKTQAEVLGKQLENKKLQTLMPYLSDKAKSEIAEANALARYHGAQASQLEYLAKQGYPTDLLRTLQGAMQLDKGQNAIGVTPGFSDQGRTKPTLEMKPESAKEVGKEIARSMEDQNILNNSYFGNKPPQIGVIPGLGPLASAVMNTTIKDPQEQYKTQMALKDVDYNMDRYKETYKTSEPTAKISQEGLNDINEMRNLYDKVTLAKGTLGGLFPALSSDRRSLDTLITRYQNQTATAFAHGRNTTQADFSQAKGEKLGANMPEDSFINISNIGEAALLGERDYDKFMKMAESKKINHDTADLLYKAYAKNRPYKNQGKGEHYLNNAFIGTMGDFLTPEAILGVQKTGDYIPPNQKSLKALNITNSDMDKFHNLIKSKIDKKVTKIDIMNIIKDPDKLTDQEYLKIASDLPRNIKIQMAKNKMAQGE